MNIMAPISNQVLRKILVINCGSSSIKFQIVDPTSRLQSIDGIAERIGTPKGQIKIKAKGSPKKIIDVGNIDHRDAFDKIFDIIGNVDVQAVGHRVVHGGDYFASSAIIDQVVKDKIKKLFPLAPLHNPKNLMGIEFIEEKLPNLPQVAVFDTSFHVGSMPAKAYRYFSKPKIGFLWFKSQINHYL